jgi:hypothetical protein
MYVPIARKKNVTRVVIFEFLMAEAVRRFILGED